MHLWITWSKSWHNIENWFVRSTSGDTVSNKMIILLCYDDDGEANENYWEKNIINCSFFSAYRYLFIGGSKVSAKHSDKRVLLSQVRVLVGCPHCLLAWLEEVSRLVRQWLLIQSLFLFHPSLKRNAIMIGRKEYLWEKRRIII